jgi:hypothetical protein
MEQEVQNEETQSTSTVESTEGKRTRKKIDKSTFFEDAEVDDSIVENNFNPLSGDVKHREYAQNIGVNDPTATIDRVPEPKLFIPPPPPPKEPTNQDGAGAASGDKKDNNPYKEKLNPDMEHLPPKDQVEASTLMVDMVLGGYSFVWDIAGQKMAIEDEKLNEIAQQGVDFQQTVTTFDNDNLKVLDFFEQYNKDVQEIFKVKPEFIEKVRPPMIREFSRRGLGVTDLQFLIFEFAKDSGTKVMLGMNLKKSINGFTEQLIENAKAIKAQGVPYNAPIQPITNNIPPTPQQPTVTSSPIQNEPPKDDASLIEEFENRFNNVPETGENIKSSTEGMTKF